MAGKKKRLAAKAIAGNPKSSKVARQERRANKLAERERRKKEKKAITPAQWNAPAPSHLVAKLDIPRIKSKYQSYFEFAENPEKKEKKLEYQVTDNATPPPGFVFVPIGDPMLTQACKELSRDQDAMIFIVSNKGREEGSKISEHIYRTGYHFREVIVDAAREIVGETIISKPTMAPGFIEPIPETQEEINAQADAAIRDLFPRIPNTDRQMIIEHAFKKGGMFHGEPTVGLQSEISLSRRVQLAVLAHIRHTHTRYDKLLRETTWINARKVVEPVCLDVLIKWRGDEETGRDQLDEILREVVVITDSEDEDDSSEDESTDEEGEITSASSTEPPSQPSSRNQQRSPVQLNIIPTNNMTSSFNQTSVENNAISTRTRARMNPDSHRDKKSQRGFNRYKAAWEEALHRRQDPHPVSNIGISFASTAGQHNQNEPVYTNDKSPINYASNPVYLHSREKETRYSPASPDTTRLEHAYPPLRTNLNHHLRGNEVNMRSQDERPVYHSYTRPRSTTTSYVVRDRPSQVVRGAPARRDPQDMPLPSIEIASSNLASPRADGQGDMRSKFDHLSGSYPRRMVEQRMQSPPQRQVIVIDDESPQVKRRRIIREDDNGHFRVGPVLSHDQDFYVTPPSRSDSHFMSTSSAETGDFLVRHPRVSQSTQGLLRHRESVFVDATTREELPIFDERGAGHNARQLAHERPPIREHISDKQHSGYALEQLPPPYARRVHVQHGFTQPSNAVPKENERPIGYRNVPESQQYHDMGQNSVRIDQDLVHSFSQSRLHGSTSRADNEFIVLSDRNHEQSNNTWGKRVHHREHASYDSLPLSASTRARSQGRYMEIPVEYVSQSQGSVSQNNTQYSQRTYPAVDSRSALPHQQPLPSGSPVYVRSIEPSRHVIVLD